jgi:uncharacterized membrane protein
LKGENLRPSTATAAVATAAVAWTLLVGSLAVARHEGLRTNAFDLGYIAQTLWNTAHGQPYRLTVLEGAPFAPEGLDPARIRRPHSYLAFHVEPALLPLAALYGLWPDPRLLLWLQALVVALGALPIAWLARHLLGGAVATLAFGLAWLLAPGLEGAALSDFHLVAFAATWLALGLFLLERGRTRAGLVSFALAALSREDAALMVAWLGLVLTLRTAGAPGWSVHGRVPIWLGLAIALGAGLWSAICFAVVAPYFNGGGSLFWSRYAWLGPTPARALVEVARDPGLLIGWLGRPDVASYLAIQALTGGLVCLLAPLELLAAGPILAMNALSSFDWMRSGGAHYSALTVPVLLWAGVHGARRVGSAGVRWAAPLAALAALAAHLWIGASPLRPGFAWPTVDPRASRVSAALPAVPNGAAVSASSDLYPQLANRSRIYWFPAREDATWIAIDALGTSHPLSPRELRDRTLDLLATGDYALEVGADGLLLLRAGPGGRLAGELFLGAVRAPGNDPEAGRPADLAARVLARLPDEFYRFAGPDGVPLRAEPVRFGPALELVGWRVDRWAQVGLFGDAVVLETLWRASAPIGQELSFALATTRRPDGAIVGFQSDAAPGALWLPTSRWAPGQLVRLQMSIDRVGGLEAAGVAVLDPSGRRLPVGAPADVPLWEGDTIARLTGL